MWIQRDIGPKLVEAASQRPALVVTGARQVGKTTLLRSLFPRHTFVSLDLPGEARMAEEDPQAFLRQFPPPLIVDEVQYAPGLFRHLKRLIDQRRDCYGDLILTGSQKFTLMQSVSDSLAGRVALFELDSLGVVELHAAGKVPSIETLMWRGGYPELHAQPGLDASAFYRSYTASYLERDVRNLLNVSHLRDFERFLRACALRSGQMLNKSELAREVGISASTANQWLSVLAASNVVSLLEPWFANGLKAVVKSPKLYFRDTGLLCFLVNIRSVEDLTHSPLCSAIWETFAFNEMRKRLALRGDEGALFYWRDRQREVDFVVHHGGRFELYDCKWTETPTKRDGQSLLDVSRLFGESAIVSRTIISRAEHAHPVSRELRAASLLDQHFLA